MAHSNETRVALRGAFLSGLPLDQAADSVGVPFATARRWKTEALAKGDDWDKFQKASLIVSGGGFDQAMGRVAAAVILRAEAVMERLGDDKEIDPMQAAEALASLATTLGKAKSAAKVLMPETDKLAVALSVLKLLEQFVNDKWPQHKGAFADILRPFGNEVAKNYGNE